MTFRTERDPLGELSVPADAYYGVQTARAVQNFPISGLRAPTALVVSTIALATVAWALVMDAGLAQTLRLPIGLPWLGAHFRLDPLAAAFLAVVNLGGATTSLYGLGYGRHEA